MAHDNLWAPWRMEYIRGLSAGDDGPDDSPCFLCAAGRCAAGDVEARLRLVLVCDERGVLLLNRFPYTSGHLLAAPREHGGDLAGLSSAQRNGMMELAALGQAVLTRAVHPQGFNLGLNLGRCAGAGVPGHLHMHIVPRWNGDTNFIHVCGQIRIVPQALEDSYEELLKTLAEVG